MISRGAKRRKETSRVERPDYRYRGDVGVVAVETGRCIWVWRGGGGGAGRAGAGEDGGPGGPCLGGAEILPLLFAFTAGGVLVAPAPVPPFGAGRPSPIGPSASTSSTVVRRVPPLSPALTPLGRSQGISCSGWPAVTSVM